MISLFLSSHAVAQDPKVAYAIGSADGKTLTFRYDNKYRQIVKDLYAQGGHAIYEYPQYIKGKDFVKPSGFTYLEQDYVKEYPAYTLNQAGRQSLTTIVFDASFADHHNPLYRQRLRPRLGDFPGQMPRDARRHLKATFEAFCSASFFEMPMPEP